MTHYIIDSKKRQEYLYLLISSIVATFGLGYTLGYLHATPSAPAEVEIASLQQHASQATNPTSAIHTARTPVDTTQPVIAGESKQTVAKPITTKQARPAERIKPAAAKPIESPKKSTPAPIPAETSLKAESVPEDDKIDMDHQSAAEGSAPEQEAEPAAVTAESEESVDEGSSQYLIQVGLFSSNENAATFVKQLQENGLEAFISTSGDEKYNVRLGPYADKAVAQQQMAEFNKRHESSAYILTRN